MTPTPGHDHRTRRRLLDAATLLFAERGFKHVTVRVICHEARANVAAINYHFRDKLGLYREALEEAAAAFDRLTDEVKEAGAGLPAEGRLRAYIDVHCAHMRQVGTTNRLQQLIHRELQDPTELLSSIVDKIWKPRFEYLAGTVGELLARPADDMRVLRAALSIHGQIVMFKPSPAHDRLGRKVKRVFQPTEVADHIAAFSLAGLSAYR